MYSDVKNENDANAAAGFELMVETNDRHPIKGLGNKLDYEFVHDGVPLGIEAITPPLPTEWANLYTSWNVDFVCGKTMLPILAAKLLAPVVLGTYQELDPGLYIVPRVVCLYMVLQYHIVTLTKDGHWQIPVADGKLRNHTDWRIQMREATHLLGEVNHVAARQFHARIDKIIADNCCVGFEIFKDIERAGMVAVWA